MPTYRYRCTSCKHEFEAFQSITADPLDECPECNSAVKRLIGKGAGLIFKGSGFYITDYRSDSYSKDRKADTGSASSGSGTGANSNKSSGADASTSADTNTGGETKGGGDASNACATSTPSPSNSGDLQLPWPWTSQCPITLP